MDSDNSSGEDVYECGRCQERFLNYDLFKNHKKNRVCKNKQRNKSDEEAVDNLNEPTDLVKDSSSSPLKENLLVSLDSIIGLATKLAFISDGENNSYKSTASMSSQLTDHDYMFLQTKVDEAGNESRLRCTLCSMYTENLKEHLEKQHMIYKEKVQEFVSSYLADSNKNKPVMCIVCETEYQTSTDLKKHKCPKVVCTDCSSAFNNDSLYENHTCLRVKTCGNCEYSFKNVALFMKHICENPEKPGQSKVEFVNGGVQIVNQQCEENVTEEDLVKRKRRCSFCAFSTIHSTQLLNHFKEKHMSDQDEQNTTSENVDINTDDETTTQLSEKCKRCRRTVPNLDKHRLVCQDQKGKTCILCKHYSRDTHDYKIHVDTHKVWLDFDDVKHAKEHIDDNNDTTIAESDKQSTTSINIDCSTLTSEDVDKIVMKITKENLNDTQENAEYPVKEESSRNQNTRKCKSCGKFIVIDVLQHHMLVSHNKVRFFRCFLDTCVKVFSKLDKFTDHVKLHSESKDMLWCGCKTCVQMQPSGIAKRKELRKEKMRQYYHKMMYKCKICWSKFPTEAGLLKHNSNESHHYPCHVCGKVQVSIRQLKIHMPTHDTARLHLCDICGLGYKTNRDLKKHRNNHSDERPFVCDSCGKAFPTKVKLNRHFVCVHNPIKAFPCTYDGCEKRFSRKDKLKDHLNTHLDVEPFKCPYCNKGFYRSDNLRDHEVLHTRNYRFKCTMCDKGYMRPKLLQVHKQREHSSDQQHQQQEVDKQNKQDTNFPPLYALYSQHPIQILPEAIHNLTAVQQLVNEQQQSAIDQYHQQTLSTAVPNMAVFDTL
ncbi:uncharacterized protein [Antedon mediterranea]|uniref:uncharacterized protein n=1 Tax=Antedon mediterranea TaxID=105859 RepID=UPI003AF429B4